MDKFLSLYRKFRDGLDWMKKNDPSEEELIRFETRIINPMDAAWDLLPPTEKIKFLESETELLYTERLRA